MNDIGRRYATANARKVLNSSDDRLGKEELGFKQELLKFEDHYIQCDECLKKVRTDQEIRFAWKGLEEIVEESVEERKRWGGLSPILAFAACILLVSTVGLAVWVTQLKQELDSLDAIKSPSTVSRFYVLEPENPNQRSSIPTGNEIHAGENSFILSIEVPVEDAELKRYALRILDSDNRALWRSDDVPVIGEGKLIVYVRPGLLKEGKYNLEVSVFNRADGMERTGGVYHFLIETNEGN
jgi:hypothetical protein